MRIWKIGLWAGLLGGLLTLAFAASPQARAAEGTPTPETYPDCRALPGNTPAPAWQAQINAAARRYLAPTQADAEAVARRLAFAPYPSPSNMCGPLSLAILRDAGLVPPNADLRRFWLFNPRVDMHVARKALPPGKFCHTHFDEALDAFDFRKFPLQPGDLLYLYAGRYDTFEHVFVVSRVDDAGRAYAVTNLNLKPEGYYVVREVLLYDPQQPGTGQVYEWTYRPYAATIGVTGHGGFELWRPVWSAFPPAPPTPAPDDAPPRWLFHRRFPLPQ